ncbi:MAG TPA: hypothetical protein VLN49_16570 [Gemmatimonadaceae bacterium]|nr:hypothetical protein [Gemmatimonadaceae bacterium]
MRLRFGVPFAIILAALTSIASKWTPFNAYYVLVGVTAVWAALDSRRHHVTQYASGLALPPVGMLVAHVFVWPVAFPWYLSLRRAIERGIIGPRTNDSSKVVWWLVGGTAALGALAFTLMMRSPGVQGLLGVAADVSKRFQSPVNVSLRGGSNLILQMPASAAPEDSAGRARWAKGVAAYARTHYAHSEMLNSVAIVLVDRTQQGAVTITRESGRYEWFAELLRDSTLYAAPQR